MAEIRLEYNAYCECGEGLGAGTEFELGEIKIVVEACSNCASEARENGKNAGYDEGHADALKEA